MTIENIEMVIKSPKNKRPDPDGFTSKLFHNFREDLLPILFRFFQDFEETETIQNYFNELNIILIPKADTDTKRERWIRENYRLISLINTMFKREKKRRETERNKSERSKRSALQRNWGH